MSIAPTPSRISTLASRSLRKPHLAKGGAAERSHLARYVTGIRAWMVVPVVDTALLLTVLLWDPEQYRAVIAMAVLSIALLTGGGRYRARLHLSVLDELPSLLARLFAAAAVVATAIALRHEQTEVVVTFLNDTAFGIGLVLLGRLVTTGAIRLSRSLGLTRHTTILIGSGPLATDLCQTLRQNPRYGLSVVGVVDDEDIDTAATCAPLLGRLNDLDDVVRRSGARVLLVADAHVSEADLLYAVREPHCMPCDLLVVPRLHQFHTQAGLPDRIGSVPIMRIRTPSLRGPSRAFKRLFDIMVASIMLVAVLPVLVVCAVGVRMEGGPGILFRQQRVGRDGVIFTCLKLRSMRPATETEAATVWSVADDERVGPVGRFLRRTSFDELPQLWNILRGDMSLVGPRPERPHFVSRFSQEFDRYHHRHRVQAGLTGLAQVSGLRGDTSIADRARYDNYYIENWSLWMDVKIMLRTVSEVVLARGR